MDHLSELKNKLAHNKENRNIAEYRFYEEDTMINDNEIKVAKTVGVLLEKERMVFASDREILFNQVMSKMDGYDQKLTHVGQLAGSLSEKISNTDHLNTLHTIKTKNLENDLIEREKALEHSYKVKEESLKRKHAQIIEELRNESTTIKEYNEKLKNETRKLEEEKYKKLLIFIRNGVVVILVAMLAFWALKLIWLGGQYWVNNLFAI